MKRRILLIPHYFYPDVASTAQIITELTEELQEDFDITVISAFPSYTGEIPEEYRKKFIVKEKYQDVEIYRVRVPELNKAKKINRIKGMVSYFIFSVVAIFMCGKQDVVFCMSQPPIVGGILGTIAKRVKRAKLIYNIQDFNPEQIKAVGYIKNNFILGLAQKLDKHTCKLADVVVVVGCDMQETLRKRFTLKSEPRNIVINNWIDENKVYPLESNNEKVLEFKERYGLRDKFVFMYSGNLGLYYDLENLIKVIGEFKYREDIVFTFVGEGTMKKLMVEYCKENGIENVKFIPYQCKEDLIYSLNAADVHIVTNAKGIKGVSVPSKIYGVMATGKYVLGVLEEGTEARGLIERSKCGDLCSPCDYQGFRQAIMSILEHKDVVALKGKLGRQLIVSTNNKSNSINKYRRLFENV